MEVTETFMESERSLEPAFTIEKLWNPRLEGRYGLCDHKA
jgi:hypothetical protein